MDDRLVRFSLIAILIRALSRWQGHCSRAVIIIPGSGAATRDGSWNMYRNIGEYLVERCTAVLLYDRRGVGGSAGD